MTREVRALGANDVRSILRVPGAGDDKYSRGVTQLVTGSDTYPGAAVLSVHGSLGSGPGMVRYGGTARSTDLVLAQFPEVVLNVGHFQSAVVGSGWDEGRMAIASRVLQRASERDTAPVVVDAGALEHVLEWREKYPAVPLILTPHLGEASRLWRALYPPGPKLPEGPQLAARLAAATESIVVLKTSTTWVASPMGLHSQFVSNCGWAAAAGSGDVLAGVIGGVVAANFRPDDQETSLVDAVSGAVWIHGTAAQQAAGTGQPIRASQIAAQVPTVIGAVLAP